MLASAAYLPLLTTSATFAPRASLVPALGFEDRTFRFFTLLDFLLILPSEHLAARRAFRAWESVLPLSFGTTQDEGVLLPPDV